MKKTLGDIFKTRIGDILRGFTDRHCHILPGVDDGPRADADALAMLREYENAGVRSLLLTPHVMEDMPNDTKELRNAFESLKRSYSGNMILELASENMLDFLFERRLQEKDFLTWQGNKLIVETSFYNPPKDLHGTLERIRKAGFTPVLAHPERYIYMDDDEYTILHQGGVKFQLNVTSFTGYYGDEVRQRAEKLATLGYCDCAGTDCHKPGEITALKEKYIKSKYADALTGR